MQLGLHWKVRGCLSKPTAPSLGLDPADVASPASALPGLLATLAAHQGPAAGRGCPELGVTGDASVERLIREAEQALPYQGDGAKS